MEEFTDEADITIYDRKTKQSRVIHWGPGHSHEFWWQSGNGCCDCNRHLYFWDWTFPDSEDENGGFPEGSCNGCERYIITHVNSEPVDFEEWNSGYKE